jgi:HAE1 family hydrophobic/amphiphilic exporter-1
MDNLDILIGSTYEQGFVRFGRFFKVYVQAAPEFRRLPSDILKLYVKNDRDEMVPYSAFMTMKKTQGPNEITRYNLYNSAAIRGEPAPGYTSGDAIRAVQEVADATLPAATTSPGRASRSTRRARGNEAIYIFAGRARVRVPRARGAVRELHHPARGRVSRSRRASSARSLLLSAMGLANDIYAQVGLVMLVGLLGKNAVLIVEFAVQRQRGVSVRDAAIAGARARFRPILMTSFAFIAGLVPLVVATGPGRHRQPHHRRVRARRACCSAPSSGSWWSRASTTCSRRLGAAQALAPGRRRPPRSPRRSPTMSAHVPLVATLACSPRSAAVCRS